MAGLEDLTKGAVVRGVLPDAHVTVVDIQWHGSAAIELTYKDSLGKLGHELMYRDREASLAIAEVGKPRSFDGDGEMLRLVSEAYRINLAHLFDPLLAVHTSNVEPLPHQITAVYEEMLTRQPLRFLLADDPGAGTAIMAGTGEEIRALCYIEHAVQDARSSKSGERRTISRQLQFVEISESGVVTTAGYAPYLDYRPIEDAERSLVTEALDGDWLTRKIEDTARDYAITTLVPEHIGEIRKRRESLIDKTMQAVRGRLLKEINYWDHRANQLRDQELAGRTPRLNSANARQRADELQTRLHSRLEELAQERQISPLPPVVIGGALVVPQGLLDTLAGTRAEPDVHAHETARVERLAVDAVMAAERALGYEAHDIGKEKRGYDIESGTPGTGLLRFIEVKGRVAGADTVTITRNEILTALNKPDQFILALVTVDGESACTPRYIRQPFGREPDFGVTSVNYNLGELQAKATDPA